MTADAVNGAEIVLQVRRPQSAELARPNLIVEDDVYGIIIGDVTLDKPTPHI